jgi:hypothetical protein
MRGRKPVPRHLKVLRGNPGKRRLNDAEPMPLGGLIDPPEWLTESQKAGWEYAMANAPRRLLKKPGQSGLVAWMVAEDLHRQATTMVARFRDAHEGAEHRPSDPVAVSAGREQAGSDHAAGGRAVGVLAGFPAEGSNLRGPVLTDHWGDLLRA